MTAPSSLAATLAYSDTLLGAAPHAPPPLGAAHPTTLAVTQLATGSPAPAFPSAAFLVLLGIVAGLVLCIVVLARAALGHA